MANEPNRFDFYPTRFLESEDVERMTAAEVGCYIILLCKSWTLAKEATLPDDPQFLADQCGVKSVSDLVLKKFPVVQTPTGPRRRNEVLYGEWMMAKDRQASASERGKKGNQTRYSDSNSGGYSEEPATATASAPEATTYHTIPNHTKSEQKESIRFTGGSFPAGTWGFISKRWYAYFQKQLSASKQNKEQYAAACSQFNEDVVLEYLEKWANENAHWVSAHPKGGNRLYVFLQALPDMIEGDQMRKEKQPAVEVIDHDAVRAELNRQAQQRELDRIKAQQEEQFEKETAGII